VAALRFGVVKLVPCDVTRTRRRHSGQATKISAIVGLHAFPTVPGYRGRGSSGRLFVGRIANSLRWRAAPYCDLFMPALLGAFLLLPQRAPRLPLLPPPARGSLWRWRQCWPENWLRSMLALRPKNKPPAPIAYGWDATLRDALLALAIATTIVLAGHIVVWAAAVAPVSELDTANDAEPCVPCACSGAECVSP
jgi:hypothetical protein